MWIGWSQQAPAFTTSEISRVPIWGRAERRLKSAANINPPSVFTDHGFWSEPEERPNSKVRERVTGMLERSGFGISVSGTWLTSGFAGSRTIRNSRNFPTHGSADLPPSASERVRSLEGLVPLWCSQRFTIQTLLPML